MVRAGRGASRGYAAEAAAAAPPPRRGRVATHLLMFVGGAAAAGLAGAYQLRVDTQKAQEQAELAMGRLAREVEAVAHGLDDSVQLAERVSSLEQQLESTRRCLNGQMQALKQETAEELDVVKLSFKAYEAK